MYHSLRSPYSYLALRSAFSIADAFGVELDVRPVLPMVMRGLSVPTSKLKYILKDADREARRHNIPFGNPFDPVGEGVERCLAVLAYAKAQGKARDFLLSVGEAIWAEGIDVASDDGMRHATERSGLFWPGVASALRDEGWKVEVEANRESLFAAGLWGVPSFIAGELVLWGRDRDWLLARQLEDRCDSGDGILV
jgi:2-hydroxychromene-2-carboxylate isomerase